MKLLEKLEDHAYSAYVDGEIRDFRLTDFKSRNIVLIFYPMDFTPVCHTELTRLSEMYEEFKEADATVVFVSADSVHSHRAWCKAPESIRGLGQELKWPMVSDIKRSLSSQLGMFNEKTGTVVRGTVILGSDLSVKHLSCSIDPVGRSSGEILRLVHAINHSEDNGGLCQVDFTPGSKSLKPY